MKSILIILCIALLSTLNAQENIEDYLLSDSLEIQALLDKTVLLDEKMGDPTHVAVFTNFGLSVRQFTSLSGLNDSFDTLGYGRLPEISLGWSFGSRFDVGDHFSFGYSYVSNFFFNKFSSGSQYSSQYTYFSFLLDLGYRYEVQGMHFIPGLSLGFSQNILSLKPNQQEEITWDDLHDNINLISSISQAGFALGANLTISKYFEKANGKTSSLDLKMGMIIHPFHFGDPSITSSEWSFVKVTDMPTMGSSGPYLTLTWGAGSASKK